MDKTIKAARKLGKMIQEDERYIAYHKTKEINDSDEGLQAAIGEFNLIRQKLSMEAGKQDESRDQSVVDSLNTDAQEAYSKIMDNPSMQDFTTAKSAMDALIREVSEIISLSCDGEDPETCSPQQKGGGCGGGCGSCGGCG